MKNFQYYLTWWIVHDISRHCACWYRVLADVIKKTISYIYLFCPVINDKICTLHCITKVFPSKYKNASFPTTLVRGYFLNKFCTRSYCASFASFEFGIYCKVRTIQVDIYCNYCNFLWLCPKPNAVPFLPARNETKTIWVTTSFLCHSVIALIFVNISVK
jgi:hypothetical protein